MAVTRSAVAQKPGKEATVVKKKPAMKRKNSFTITATKQRVRVKDCVQKKRPAMKRKNSFTITGTKQRVRVNDCVLVRPSEDGKPLYVARVENIELDEKKNMMVHCRWYYRPEDTMAGRKRYHGEQELFLSDHWDIESVHTIEGKCVVHSYETYINLEEVGPDEYYCRNHYQALTGDFIPNQVVVFCTCEMPNNPDDLMVDCDKCCNWFHPVCIGMTDEEAKEVPSYVCAECISAIDVKRPRNKVTSPTPNDCKVETKRRSRRRFKRSGW